MIFHFHAPNHGSIMVGGDYVPRRGELLRLGRNDVHTDGTRPFTEDFHGLFLVEQVMYTAPNNPGNQRVDVYGQQVGVMPPAVGYTSISEALGGEITP